MASRDALIESAKVFMGTYLSEKDRQEEERWKNFYGRLAAEQNARQQGASERDAKAFGQQQEMNRVALKQSRVALKQARTMFPLEQEGATLRNAGQSQANTSAAARESREAELFPIDKRGATARAEGAETDNELAALRLEMEKSLQPARLKALDEEELAREFNFAVKQLTELRQFAKTNPITGAADMPEELRVDDDMWLRMVSGLSKEIIAKGFDVDIEFPDGTMLQGGPSFGYVKLPGAPGIQGPSQVLGAGSAKGTDPRVSALAEELRGVTASQGPGAKAGSSEAEVPVSGLAQMTNEEVYGTLQNLMQQLNTTNELGTDAYGNPSDHFLPNMDRLRGQVLTVQEEWLKRVGSRLGTSEASPVPASSGPGSPATADSKPVSGLEALTRAGKKWNEDVKVQKRDAAKKLRQESLETAFFYVDDDGILRATNDEDEAGTHFERDPSRVLDGDLVDVKMVGKPYNARFDSPVTGGIFERKRYDIGHMMRNMEEGLFSGGT